MYIHLAGLPGRHPQTTGRECLYMGKKKGLDEWEKIIRSRKKQALPPTPKSTDLAVPWQPKGRRSLSPTQTQPFCFICPKTLSD